MSLVNYINKAVRWVAYVGVLATAFLFTQNAHAINAISQTSIGTSYNALSGNNGNLGQSFVATFSGSINYLQVPYWRYRNVSGFGALCSVSLVDVTSGTGASASSSLQLPTTIPTSDLNTWSKFMGYSGTLATQGIISGHTYWAYPTCGNGTQFANTQWLGSSSDVMGGVFGTSSNFGTTITATGTLADAGIVLDVSVTSSQIILASTPLSTCNFSNWGYNLYSDSTDTSNCINDLSYNCSIGVALNAGSFSESDYIFNSNGHTTAEINGISYFANNFTFVSGTVYHARMYYCSKNTTEECYLGVGENPNILAVSNDWQFIVNGLDTCSTTYFSQNSIPPPGAIVNEQYTSLVSQANAQCNAFSDGSVLGGVVYGICRALVFLFVPSQDSLSNFSNLKTQVSAKPPIGYFNIYANQLNTFSTTNTTSTVASSTGMNFSSAVSVYATYPFFTYILTGIAILVYVAFAFYMYWRFKHFSLHG